MIIITLLIFVVACFSKFNLFSLQLCLCYESIEKIPIPLSDTAFNLRPAKLVSKTVWEHPFLSLIYQNDMQLCYQLAIPFTMPSLFDDY